ncbi:conserved hypothetical protein [Candidatus Sulfopaludibacter sp. SbA3]|nr:conserved hypothetical protein [Candidatus Sulfopaludibacter sp. SbA3]
MDALLLRGIELFNREEFFECHEVWEELWTPERGPRRLFLQAMIHMAVACYHCQRGNPRGAQGQFTKGLRKLAEYLPDVEEIDTGRLYRDCEAVLDRVRAAAPHGGFPRIQKIRPGEAANSTASF